MVSYGKQQMVNLGNTVILKGSWTKTTDSMRTLVWDALSSQSTEAESIYAVAWR